MTEPVSTSETAGAPADEAAPNRNGTEQATAETHITKRSWARWVLDGVVGLIIVGGVVSASVFAISALHLRAAAEQAPATAAPITVNVAKVALQDSFEITRQYVGRIEAARSTAASFDLGGRVLDVLVDEGDAVGEGQVLARLDTARLAVARRQLEAQVRELEARRELAKLTLDRQRQLNRREFASAQRVDEARSSLTETGAVIDRLKAEIDRVDLDIAKSELKAPFAGVVGARSLDEGAVVTAGSPVVTLLEVSAQLARIGLPPKIADTLQPGATYGLQTPALTVEAKFTALRPDLQASTRTVSALFAIAQSSAQISATDSPAAPTSKPVALPSIVMGEIATLSVTERVDQRGAWIPVTALKEGIQGLWTVLLVTPGDAGQDVVSSAAVEVLHSEGDRVFVRGTLRDGDTVITDGTHRVVTGQQIATLQR